MAISVGRVGTCLNGQVHARQRWDIGLQINKFFYQCVSAVEWELAEGTVVGAHHDADHFSLNPTTRHGPDLLPCDEPLPELSIFRKT